MTTNDRATLLALELIRRQLGGLPGEFARALADMDAASVVAEGRAPKDNNPKLSAAKIEGFDATAANTANRLAAQGWPKVIQLVNLLLGIVAQRALGGAPEPRAIAAPREGIPLPASGTATNAAKGARTRNATFGPYLDEAADILRKLRDAVGNRTSKAFKAATVYVSRNAKRLAKRASNAWQNSRPGRAFMREWNSRTGKQLRSGAVRGAKALGRGAMAGGKAVGGALLKAFNPFMLKLLAVLGPMALLAATLNQASSGFQLVISSVKLLASSLAPILLPFAFMLAAGLATLSDVVWAELVPNLGKWYSFIVDNALPVMVELVDKFKSLIDAVKWIIEVARDPSKLLDTNEGSGGEGEDGRTGLEKTADTLQTITDPLGIQRWITGKLGLENRSFEEQRAPQRNGGAGDFARGSASASGPEDFGGPGAGGSAGGASSGNRGADTVSLLKQNMQDTLKELQMSVGPKASFQGLAQASKSAQLVALNQSPYEAKMLQKVQEVINTMTKVVDNTAPQARGRHQGD